jgi:hypothetical protein
METEAIIRPPRWYWIVAGVAVAWMLFGVMAVIVQFGYLFLAMDTLRLLGPGAMVFPLVVFLVGVFLLWLSIHARNCSWLS